MKNVKTILAACATIAFMPAAAHAGAIIDNGEGIQLGINDEGHLNFGAGSPSVSGTTLVGLRHLTGAGEFESTSHGCACEGWGAAGGGQSGAANVASNGVDNITLVSFAAAGAGTDASSTGSSATSVVEVGTALRVTHAFAPSASDNLYQVHVTIENISGADIANLLYRRTFDWDIDPTPFNEFSTIGGTAAATAVLASNDNGFCSSDPTDACTSLTGAAGDFVDAGPGDIGANFDFDFGTLLAGAIFEFDIFYGAAFSEREAFAALFAVDAEVFSFGQAVGDETGGSGSTFIFAFKGVGGRVIGTPEPGMLGMFGLGLVGLALARRRRGK